MLKIHSDITNLAVEEDFRQTILEDIELAVEYFKEKNVLSVFNSLTVLIGKIHSYQLLTRSHGSTLGKILIDIHELQGLLVKLPVSTVGPAGATGATGPVGPAGTPGSIGQKGATGPGGPITVVTNGCPSARFPCPKNAQVSSSYFAGKFEPANCFRATKNK